MRKVVIVCAVVLVLGLAAGSAVLLARAARVTGEFRRHVAAHFKPRRDCPVPEPFVESNVDYDCFAGALASGQAIELVLGMEPGSRATVWNYIGIFVPGGTAQTVAPLVARVRVRGDWWGRRQGGAPSSHLLVPPPESEPVRAEVVDDGVFVAWRLQTLPTVAKLTERMDELDRLVAAQAAAVRAAP